MKPELKIIVQLCEQVSIAEGNRLSKAGKECMPAYTNAVVRESLARIEEADKGFCSALLIAIAQTDLTVEQAARLASGHEYERAAGFIRRNQQQIEMHRQARLTRDRIAAERGEEFCLYCGSPCDGSYCGLNCLEADNAEAIAESDLSTEAWIIQNMA